MSRIFVVACCIALVSRAVAAQSTIDTVLFNGKEPISLAGVGITLPAGHTTRAMTDDKGRPIEWREVRTHVDHLGQQHRLIAQFLQTPWGEVRIDGSEVGLHYNQDGSLRFAEGDQFTRLSVDNAPSFSLVELPARALQALRPRHTDTIERWESAPRCV